MKKFISTFKKGDKLKLVRDSKNKLCLIAIIKKKIE